MRTGAALAVCLGLVAGGCARRPLPADLVARVGGVDVPYSAFETFLDGQVGEGAGGLDSRVLSRLFDQFLDEELVERWAVEEGLVPPGSGRRRAVEAILASAGEEEPDAALVERWYRDHRDELARPERVELRHILAVDRSTAEAAREEILAGGDFGDVARRVSEDPSAPQGGRQGEIAIADLPLPFAGPVAELAPGEVSEVFEASDGFHLFLVERRLPGEVLPLADVEPLVREQLRRERGDALLHELAAAARDRYDVELYPQNLPFHYQGTYSDEAISPPES